MFESYALAFLELTFILISLMLLHRLRQAIGTAPFYLGAGAVMVFGQIVASSGIRIYNSLPALSIEIGPVVFIAPFMALLLITYVVDGTLAAQRLIWGVIFLVGITFYLSYLTERQVLYPSYEVEYGIFSSNARASELFSQGRTFILASLLSILIEFLVLPIVYEILRHRGFGVAVSVTCALVFTQVIDVFFFELVTNPFHAFWWDRVRHAFIARATAMIWLSFLTVIYLRMRHAKHTHETSSRRPLDLAIAFLGAYGHAQKLRANVREWEGRYRMVFDNTHDLTFLVGETGMIIDVNEAAVRKCGYSIEEMLQMNIESPMKKPFAWSDIWSQLFEKAPYGHWKIVQKVAYCEATLVSVTGEEIILEATVTPIFLQQHHGAIFSARDVTQRRELERELSDKQKQLIHSQRMEAVGTLAGGIAHDFNNLLHAIQGSVDSLEQEINEDSSKEQLLKNISGATKRAAGLTGQLLGFARGGKYKVDKLIVNTLIKDVEQLFLPLAGRKVTFRVVVHPDPMIVEGDVNQLQQVLLNLLLNARDALPDTDGKIIVRVEPAAEHTPGMDKKPPGATGSFVAIRVKDNGHGMDADTLARIFEPFYTTKGTSGTGMGLAMAYGCIENHNGWMHVASTPGKGTEFVVFLPRSS